jgi:hypothetical protein
MGKRESTPINTIPTKLEVERPKLAAWYSPVTPNVPVGVTSWRDKLGGAGFFGVRGMLLLLLFL